MITQDDRDYRLERHGEENVGLGDSHVDAQRALVALQQQRRRS